MFENKNKFIPVTDWNQYHPWPRIGGLRHLIFHADTNDFNKVIVRAGRRVLIDEQAFFDWLNERRGCTNPSKKMETEQCQ